MRAMRTIPWALLASLASANDDGGCLMQLPEVRKPALVQPSSVARVEGNFLESWKDLARLWLRPHALRNQTLLSEQVDTQAQDHAPTDLMWMTMVPCVIIFIVLAWAAAQLLATLRGNTPKQGKEEERGMTEMEMMFNIVKNIVGEGMLSLPAGIAGGTGLLAGSFLAVLFAMLMGYTFSIMGRVCAVTGQRSHKDCAKEVSGPLLGEAMALTLLVKTVFTCLAFAIVIGESFSRILHYCGFTGAMATTQAALLLMCVFVLVPLCLQRELSVLAYTSMIGCLGQVWVVFTMHIRYMDGSYRPGGRFYDQVAPKDQPDFSDGVIYWKTSAATFVLLGSLATAFIAHYNAPKYYAQLQDATPAKFTKVVCGAFAFATIIYFWIMAVGYLTFGSAAEGLILNNYSEQDGLVTTARFAISFAVVFAFPLGFTGLRDATMSTFNISQDRFRTVTFLLLAIIITAACFFHDLGLANSLGGAILGALITMIFPALLLYGARDSVEISRLEGQVGGGLVLTLGFILLLFGSSIVVIAKFYPEVLAG